MAYRALNPYQVFLDAAGEELSGGSIQFTKNNDVNTDIAIYSDESATTLQANPYTLDAAGRITGDVWITEIQYTMVIRDSLGAFVRRVDDNGQGEESQADVIISEINNRFRNGGFAANFGESPDLTAAFAKTDISGVVGQCTNVSSGKLQQSSNAIGVSGWSAAMAPISTAAGAVASYGLDMPRGSTFDLVEKEIIVKALIQHDVGSSRTVTPSLWCPTAIDDFDSPLTLIHTASPVSVVSGVTTEISFTVDCATLAQKALIQNGLRVIYDADIGGVSGANIYLADFSLNVGNVAPTFVPEPAEIQDSKSIRQLEAMVKAAFTAIAPAGTLALDPGSTITTSGYYLQCLPNASASKAQYPELYAAYGGTALTPAIYGDDPLDSSKFMLPPYSGQFLRVTDNGAGVDPDAATRGDRGDGVTGDNVGTTQGSENVEHTHRMFNDNTNYQKDIINAPDDSVNWNSGDSGVSWYAMRSSTINSAATLGKTSESGGGEARPTNIYVDVWVFVGIKSILDATI